MYVKLIINTKLYPKGQKAKTQKNLITLTPVATDHNMYQLSHIKVHKENTQILFAVFSYSTIMSHVGSIKYKGGFSTSFPLYKPVIVLNTSNLGILWQYNINLITCYIIEKQNQYLNMINVILCINNTFDILFK